MEDTITFNLSALYSPSTEKNVNVVPEASKPMPKKCECVGCKSKLMLTDIKCKCEKFFCSRHRYADDHKCGFDYKSDGINNLKKQLVCVSGEKLEKI